MVAKDLEHSFGSTSQSSSDDAEELRQPGLQGDYDRVVRRGSATKVDMPENPREYTVSSTPSIGRLLFSTDNRVLMHKISPSNLFWLRFYKVVLNSGVLLLVVAYTFYIIGLFEPILYLDAGEFTDPDLFQPFYETLPHSLLTLYRQQSYFTVAVAGLFSITLPFVKMIVTVIAYATAVAHRRIQLLLFFGEQPIERSGALKEDDGYIKYAREMLIFLKLVSKFQMVDVVVLLLNAVFLRCAVLWARPGKGLLYLIIYCLFSIAGAQMINFAVEGEKEIFETWYAIKYAILPEEISADSSIATQHPDGGSDKGGGVTVNKRWFVSEDFICLMACLNILSCISLMTNEKLMTVSFTMDLRKILAIDVTTMSYKEVLSSLHGMDYGALSIFVLLFLCILFPMIFSVLFLACIFGYNYCKHNKNGSFKSVEIAESDDEEPCLEYDWDVRWTRFVFNLCNIVSEWSCGEVVSLGTMAAVTSMTTADRVKVTIPPMNTCSAFFMMATYGISSFVLTAVFYIWNQNVKFEFNHIRIYVKYLESPNRNHIARILSNNNFNEYIPMAPCGSLDLGRPYAVDNGVQRRHLLLPYVEFVRRILYSKWLSSLFFGSLTAVTILLAMSAYTLSHPSPHLHVKEMDRFLHKELYEIFNLAMKQVPDSIGDCGYLAHPPVVPCSGNAALFSTQNKVHFSLVWLSGLKSISLEDATYSLSIDHRMTFKLRFHIKKLRAYARLASVEDDNLKNMLAGVIETDGDGFTTTVQLSTKCVNRRPQVRELRVDRITLDGFRALGKLYTVLSSFANVEEVIAGRCTKELNRFLSDPTQVVVWRGVSFDLAEFVNLLISQNWPTNFVCPSPER
ncbi:uncharacterized protein BXIN_2840 [Babesia sp. Xinjiang]|uniref:uncharacterized protein n=1 Tax=Babesia sp. Xinjiang TaxID=462227 RepID=UPI000A239959|nr:uncharacterized protein BXIN_2840 [Babesia sp. Xinjiang]ORM39384.1 hypothetical protein BXIN_2840 [Babesia sp. Xinjiang]